jgi:large subunit ribosomal protein L9
MATEVILMDTVKDLGKEGQIVKVKDGYARNFLFPKKLAAPVSEGTRRQLVKLQAVRAAAAAEAAAAAKAAAAKLAGVSVTLTAKTSDGEHLYGSVGAADIAAALVAQGFEIGREAVMLQEPIKELGVLDVNIRLDAGAEATIKVWVVEE